MKSLSCISLPALPEPSPPNATDYDQTVELAKVGTYGKATGPSLRGPKIHTLLDVIRCELAKPAKASKEEKGYYGIRPAQGWTPIHFAAYYNREGALGHFLCGPRSIDASTGTVDSPLLVAVAAGHPSIVKALCGAGANVNAKTHQAGETALHLAIKSGRADIMDVILSCNPELNARTAHRQETPLHYAAARTDSLTFVTALLKHGASVELLDAGSRTPAEAAILRSNINAAIAILDIVREDDSKLAKEKRMLADHAEQEQNRATMSLEHRAKINAAACPRGSTFLVAAIQQEDVELTANLLKRGSDPNRGTVANIRPIFAALELDGPLAIQIIRLLAEHRVDATVRDLQGLTVLQAVLERASQLNTDDVEVLFEILIQCGADPRALYADRKTLLHHTVRFPVSNAKLAERLVTCGVDVGSRDVEDSTALHYATTRDCVEMLLNYGADPLATNKAGLTPLLSILSLAETEPDLTSLIRVSNQRAFGPNKKTALHVAAERGLVRTVRMLLVYQGLSELREEHGRVPLILAILAQQWHVVPFLARQPGINARDLGNRTALHHLAVSKPLPASTWADIADATVLFCERGVSRSLRDEKGRTPLILAVIELPEDGVPVVEALLTVYRDRDEAALNRGPVTSNVIGHEDCTYRSALYYAIDLAKPAFVLALLKRGAPFSFNDWRNWTKEHRGHAKYKEVIKLLAEHEYRSRVRRLICLSGQINPETNSPTDFPVEELEELLELGLDPNALPAAKPELRGSLLWTILNQTVSVQARLPLSHLSVALQLLHKYGADMNAVTMNRDHVPIQDREAEQQAPYRHPLTFLLEEKGKHLTVDIVNQLLKYGCACDIASPIYQGRYPLHSAVAENRMDIVRVLLSTGSVDVNPLDEKMQSPLFIACDKGLEDMAAILLKANASVNIRNSEKRTSLHCATAAQNEGLVNKLLEAGATPLEPDDELIYPLERTISRRSSMVSFTEPLVVDDDEEVPELPPLPPQDAVVDETTRLERERTMAALSRPRRSPPRRPMGNGMHPRAHSQEMRVPSPLNGRPLPMGTKPRAPTYMRGPPNGPSMLPRPVNGRMPPSHGHGNRQMHSGTHPGGPQVKQHHHQHLPSPLARSPINGGHPNSPRGPPNQYMPQVQRTRSQVTTPSPLTRPVVVVPSRQPSVARPETRQPSPLSQSEAAPESPVESPQRPGSPVASPSPGPPASPRPVRFEEPPSSPALVSPATENTSPPPTQTPSPDTPEDTEQERRKPSRSRSRFRRPNLLKKSSFSSTLALAFPFHRRKKSSVDANANAASSESLDHAGGAQPGTPTAPGAEREKHPLNFLRKKFSSSRLRLRSRSRGPNCAHDSISANGSTATLDSGDVMILNGGRGQRKENNRTGKDKGKENSRVSVTATSSSPVPPVPDLPLRMPSMKHGNPEDTGRAIPMPPPAKQGTQIQYQTLDPRAVSNTREPSRSPSRERATERAGQSPYRLTLSTKPRVDSGVTSRTVSAQATQGTEGISASQTTQTTQTAQTNRKPWPTLDPRAHEDEWDRRGRSRETRTPTELADWLQISQLMDRLN